MPEYLAPGVYVEEVSFRSKSIEGVSTTTTAFVGPARYGPVAGDPPLLTSLLDFERTYGDRGRLVFSDAGTTHNYLWHSVRAFFENGGARLYVQRVFKAGTTPGTAGAYLLAPSTATPPVPPTDAEKAATLQVSARFPGVAGERLVRFTLQRGQNILAAGDVFNGLQNLDVVWIGPLGTDTTGPARGFYLAKAPVGGGSWTFESIVASPPPTPGAAGAGRGANADAAAAAPVPKAGRDQVAIVTVKVSDFPADPNTSPGSWSGLPLDPGHQRAGQPDSLSAYFAEHPANRGLALTLPIVIKAGATVLNGGDTLKAFFAAKAGLLDKLDKADSTEADRSVDLHLTGGNDGARPTSSEYEGGAGLDDKTGLKAFEDIDDISIVAAPGSTYGFESAYKSSAATITSLLVGHCERMRYRIAVLDSGDGQSIAQVRAMRAAIDSTHAAFYYPWVTALDPVTQQEIQLPPSGFVSGIYARNDIQRAVYKAPANEVVTLALGFEKTLNKAQQDVLNPEGINCFRFFADRGNRLWGARTATSDPEWKYVNLRRYFAYLEHSIDRGTQWAVFEPNGERLWANVRHTVEDFLLNEFLNGALLGTKPEQAYFVKCDRSTMSQNDLDNGRLVCLVGVAPLRPAEFVVFRIGQMTADAKN